MHIMVTGRNWFIVADSRSKLDNGTYKFTRIYIANIARSVSILIWSQRREEKQG